MFKLSDAHRRRLRVRRTRNQYRRCLIGQRRLRQDEIPIVPNSFECVMQQLCHRRNFTTIPEGSACFPVEQPVERERELQLPIAANESLTSALAPVGEVIGKNSMLETTRIEAGYSREEKERAIRGHRSTLCTHN